ncbi:MAG: RDD family protein [Candidatus Acidiferrales bacterium]
MRASAPASVSAPARRTAVEVAPTDGNLAIEHDWQREVHSRLAAYRVRRRTLRQPEGQTALPFASARTAEAEREIDADRGAGDGPVDWLPPSPAVQSPGARARAERNASASNGNTRVEISIEQPNLDWDGAARQSAARIGALESSGAQMLRPVASLADRRIAAVLDAVVLLFTFGGILALFCALGGRFTLTRMDAAIAVATLGLFYAQYFMLFTVFGGSTPGMMMRGLRVVSFDGDMPTPRQMLWRSFGYMISAGTFMLGYLWALWDEDHLCWQDRISQTYLTRVSPAENPLGQSARSALL